MKFRPATAPAVLTVVLVATAGAPAMRIDPPEERTVVVGARAAAAAGSEAVLYKSPAQWGRMTDMMSGAIGEARAEGHEVALVARQLGYGVAAGLTARNAPAPTITDNELGGLVFYWKGRLREIQIEIDADSSHFVRIKGADGRVTFTQEGIGPIPLAPVNAALEEWGNERLAAQMPTHTA